MSRKLATGLTCLRLIVAIATVLLLCVWPASANIVVEADPDGKALAFKPDTEQLLQNLRNLKDCNGDRRVQDIMSDLDSSKTVILIALQNDPIINGKGGEACSDTAIVSAKQLGAQFYIRVRFNPNCDPANGCPADRTAHLLHELSHAYDLLHQRVPNSYYQCNGKNQGFGTEEAIASEIENLWRRSSGLCIASKYDDGILCPDRQKPCGAKCTVSSDCKGFDPIHPGLGEMCCSGTCRQHDQYNCHGCDDYCDGAQSCYVPKNSFAYACQCLGADNAPPTIAVCNGACVPFNTAANCGGCNLHCYPSQQFPKAHCNDIGTCLTQ